MAIAVIEAVVALLALFSQTELGKELDHEAAAEIKSLHDRAHALRQRVHSKLHNLFHKKGATKP